MIINGGSRRAGGWWAKHLENAEKNERVTLAEIVGLDAATIPDLFHEMEILARNSGSKAENYFYQANVNPRDHEHLTPAQRHEAKELLLENLGLSGQPHFVVEHEKAGRVHFHVIAFRIDMERGRAISDSLTAQIHERTSRELEIRFDLERGKSVLVPDRDFERPERGAKKYEIFRGAEGGIDPETVKADARLAWARADSGVAFKAALEASGDYVLARGDRRDFVIIDRAGDDHSLARRLGEKAKAVRERMADLDPASLPNAEQAKAMQRERQAERAAQPEAVAITLKEAANQNTNVLGQMVERAIELGQDTPENRAREEDKDQWHAARMQEMREAARAPQFSRATIEADPWTAVYLPIPENAPAELLAFARQSANGLVQCLEAYQATGRPQGQTFDPVIIGSEYTRAENLSHAGERTAELDARLELRVIATPTPDMKAEFRAGAASITEPAAPLWDRDADARAADERDHRRGDQTGYASVQKPASGPNRNRATERGAQQRKPLRPRPERRNGQGRRHRTGCHARTGGNRRRGG